MSFHSFLMIGRNVFKTLSDFNFDDKPSVGSFKAISHSRHEDVYIRQFWNINSSDDMTRFSNYVADVKSIKHQCFAPLVHAILPNQDDNLPACLVTKYFSNGSLQDLLNGSGNNDQPFCLDIAHQYMILYGVASFMEFMHANKLIHGRLRASNVLLNELMEPKVTDICLNDISTDDEENPFIPPEVQQGAEYTDKSDVFSFGVLAFQVLKGMINIYEDKIEDEGLIQKYIVNGVLPSIPIDTPDELRDIISKCFEIDQELRPTFKDIAETLIEASDTIEQGKISIFKNYLEKLTNEENLPDQLVALKNEADNGDKEMMYLYACARLDGDNCSVDKEEAYKYLEMAAEKGHLESLQLLSGKNIMYDDSQNFDNNDSYDQYNALLNSENATNTGSIQFRSLYDDPSFKQKEKFDFQEVLNDVKKNIDNREIREFTINENSTFIYSDDAIGRLTKLCEYIEYGVPVLLEGPTGTSKTLSAEKVCQLLGKKLERFNLSSETKAADLLGRYVGDKDSWAGITHIDGPFVRAFRDGHCLLLDEINLASENVLQCIQESLDSGVISIEISGMPLQEIKMNEGAVDKSHKFCLIATQNPNKGLFAHKRQNHGIKFLSRFQVINFPAFKKNELLTIAQGLSKQFGYNDSNQIIEHLVDFHSDWSTDKKRIDEIQCFTIREIAATVKALSNDEDIFDAVMTIYGARYPDDIQKLLIETFKKHFKIQINPKRFIYPENFPSCFHNEVLSKTLKHILFSFKNKRNVILTGKQGCGKTQIARWIAEWYSAEISQDRGKSEYYYVCTEETKCSDLIGRLKAPEIAEAGHELIMFEMGFLTRAVMEGGCVVLDNMNEAPATVSERLNSLLDEKYDGETKIFDIPENPSQKQIEVHPHFRIICNYEYDKLGSSSPAFLNRLDDIYIDNQLSGITEREFKELIVFLMKRSGMTQAQAQSDQEQKKIDNDLVNDFFGVDEEEEEEEEEKEETKQPVQVEEYVPSDSLVNLVLNSIKGSNISLVSKICKAVVTYSKIMPLEEGFEEKEIVEFAINMLIGDSNFSISDKIKRKLQSLFKQMPYNDDSMFFYEESDALVTFMCKLMASSLINLHLCVYGPTGVGKTSAARAFSRIRFCSRKAANFQMHSFHSGTKPNHFYGTTTIRDGRIVYKNGTLTTAMQNGEVFIADEMNLASASTMKALAPALEPNLGGGIFIPGIDVPVVVKPDFFFIACQNELGTIGRNAVPLSIASHFRVFYYPEQTNEDIEKICINIFRSNYSERDINKFNEKDANQARMVGRFMMELNSRKQAYIPHWSLRDISKIFRRVYHMRQFIERFLNFEIYHHVLFYTLSPVGPENLNNVIGYVVDLIGMKFDLDENQKKDLISCYTARPKIESIPHRGSFAMNGKIGISINYIHDNFLAKGSENFNSYNLFTLWDSVFKILLSDPSEPVLLLGLSSFKTFLAKLFLINSSPITLNQESTIAQLLGSSGFFSASEAKIFYLEYICKICKCFEEFPKMKSDWEDGKLERSDIEEITKRFHLSNSFNIALDLLTKKLFEKETGNNCVLSNIILEFRPGVILNAILEHKSLILKNITNLQTVVLERFNELFSGKQNLTLNEDIHNTFTDENDKEFTNFSSYSRVMATCSSNSINKLSEPIQSRLTVIFIPSYQLEEQKYVLESYVALNKLNFEPIYIDNLIKLAKNFNEKKLTISQMIKTIELCSRLNKESENSNQLQNLAIITYRLFGGFLNSMKAKNELFSTISSHICKDIPQNILNYTDEPISIEKDDNLSRIKSNISEYSIKSPKARIPNLNVAFIPVFNEMVDILHLGIMIHNPVIFEGQPGQGKQLAIKYIAESIGYEVINIIISESTKVEDLLGKVDVDNDQNGNIHVKMIETKLVKTMKSDSEASSTIIVFHNLNNATPAVLNVIDNIFATDRDKVTLTDGSVISKGKLNVVAIFNSQSGFNTRDKLPTSLIVSSIYYIVRNPNKYDIASIINTVFSQTEFAHEKNSFAHKFIETKKICSNSNTSVIITVNDIIKYVTLRKATFNIFDEATISQMIFAYRFPQEEMIQHVLQTLHLNTMKINPQFTFNTSAKKVYIKLSNESKTFMDLPLYSEINPNEIELMINGLTVPQKQCLIFLASSVRSDRACLIQGGTASGKSHSVRLFSKMLGKKLFIYQMNPDTGISILSGQSILKGELSKSDIITFRKSMNTLKVNSTLSTYISKYFESIKPDKWTPQLFNELIKLIDDVIQKENLKEALLDSIVKARDMIDQTRNPAKRFHHVESSFIKAMTEGHWVLIDGIESAPSSISEKISSLCGEEPELNLYECGKGFYFSRNDRYGSRRIHKDFHLFVTFNPVTQGEHKVLDHSFTNKCLTFTLPPIDSTIEYSTQVLYGSLIQSLYETDISIEISARMANMHRFAKQESTEDQDSFAGELQFSGRTLIFDGKAFSAHPTPDSNVHKPICHSIKSFYWNSYTNESKKEQFHKTMITKLCEDPSIDLHNGLDSIQTNPKERNRIVLTDLYSIQVFVRESGDRFPFDFRSFIIEKSKNITMYDLSYVYDHLCDTINTIEANHQYDDINAFDNLEKLSCLKIIKLIFKSIISNSQSLNAIQSTLKISDSELFESSFIVKPFCEYHLLSELLFDRIKDESLSLSSNLPIFLVNPLLFNLLEIIINLSRDQTFHCFVLLIEYLHQYQSFIPLVDKIIPYYKFYGHEYEMICYLIPLLVQLSETQTTFSIKYQQKKLEFKYNDLDPIYVSLVFNDHDNLMLGAGTSISKMDNTKKSILAKYKKNSTIEMTKSWNYKFCLVCQDICKNKWNNDYNHKIYAAELINKELISLASNVKKLPKDHLFLSSLYLIQNKSNMISKLWSIAFYLSSEDIEKIIDFLHPLESGILRAIVQFKENLNPELIPQIINFTKWLHNFGSPDSYLWRLLTKENVLDGFSSIEDFKSLRGEIAKEISELKKAPILDEEIWTNQEYIEILETGITEITSKINELSAHNEELKYKNLYQNLIEKVNKIKLTKDEYKTMKTQILKHLSFLSNTKKPNQSSYEAAKIKVENFERLIQKTGSLLCTNSINWPSYSLYDANSSAIVIDERQKMINLLIWFSHMHQLLDKIIYGNDDPMLSMIELMKNQDMKNISDMMFSIFMRNSGSKIKDFIYDVNIIYSTLNALFIFKVYETRFGLKLIPEISNILNKYIQRDKIAESEFKWAHEIINLYQIDFGFILPKFKPNDLIFIFMNKNGESNDDYTNGPLTSALSVPKIEAFQKSLVHIMNSDFNSMKECALKIGHVALNAFSDQKVQDTINEIQLIKALESIKKNETGSLIKWVIFWIKNSETILSNQRKEFIFEDCEFLKPNCFENQHFVNKYPSLVFWLVKNYQCWKQLQSLSIQNAYNKDILPLWLYCFRVMSSQNCIRFETQSTTSTSETISYEINSSIMNAVKYRNISGYGWTNLLIMEIPNEFIVPRLRMIYTFLNYLNEDNKSLPEFLELFKSKSVKQFVQKLLEEFYKSNINALYNKSLGDKEPIIQFIKDPAAYIKFMAKSEIDEKINILRKSLDYQKILANCNKIKDILPGMTFNLESQVKQAKEAMNNENERAQRKIYEDNRRKNIDMKLDEIKNYNQLLSRYEKASQSKKDFRNYSMSLLRSYERMKQYGVLNNEPVRSIIEFRCSTKLNNDLRMKVKKGNGEDSKCQIVFKKGVIPVYYFSTDIYSAISLASSKFTFFNGKECRLNNYSFSEIIFFGIRSDADDIILKMNQTHEIQSFSCVQSFFFGSNNIRDDDFINKLKKFIELAKNFNKYDDLLKNHSLEFQISQYLNDLQNQASYLILNCSMQNHIKSEPISHILQKDIKPLLNQFKSDLKQLITEIKEISPKYNDLKNNNQIFKYDYSIKKIPDRLNKAPSLSFDSMDKIEVLSSPIINVSESNQISCCYNPMYCSIGPLIPSLYSNSVVVNMLSFINEDLNCEIQFEKYNEAFSVSKIVKPGELVKIYVSLSNIKVTEIVDEIINGNLTMSSNSHMTLKLPVQFDLKLIPNDVLLTCDEYEIAYNEGSFRLKSTKFFSETQIQLKMKNCYSFNFGEYSATMRSLEDNDCEAPKISFDKKKGLIDVTMPCVEKISHLNCLIEIGYSSKTSLKLLVDAIIVPFEFKLEAYDFYEKKYKTDSIRVYSHNCKIIKQFPIFFRISCPIDVVNSSKEGEITINLPSQMSVIKEGISSKFVLQQESTDFKLVIDHSNSFFIENAYGIKYYVQVQIGRISKRINLDFVRNGPLFSCGSFYGDVMFFPTYIFNNEWKDFVRVTNNLKYDRFNPPTIVSMFDAYIKPSTRVMVKYDQYKIEIIPKTNEYMFIQINSCGNHQKVQYSYENRGFYSILGYNSRFGSTDWVPAFSSYPRDLMANWNFIAIEKENAEIAKNDFKEILNGLSCDDINSLDPRDFRTFICLFKSLKVIKALSSVIDSFPPHLRNVFSDYVEKRSLRTLLTFDSDEINLVKAHNFILKAYQCFVRKFDEVEYNNKLNDQQSEKDIALIWMQRAFDEYHTVDSLNHQHRNNSNDYQKEINKIQLMPLPPAEKFNGCYLIKEKACDNPEPYNDSQGIHRFNTQNPMSVTTSKNFAVKLPDIKVPSNPSIDSLIKFYITCQNATRTLPLFIRNLKYDGKQMSSAENYFGELFKVYQNHTCIDRSFISVHVNSYIESFKQMVGRLRKSGITFSNLPIELITDLNATCQDFIQIPLPDQINLPPKKWECSQNRIQAISYSKAEHFSQERISMMLNPTMEPELPKILSIETNENENQNEIVGTQTPEKLDKFEISKAISQIYAEMGEEEEDRNEFDEENSKNRENKNKKEQTRVLTGKESIKTITKEKLEESKYTESELDGIERSIQKMKSISNENQMFSIPDLELNAIDKKYFVPSKNTFPVRELIEKSLHLSSNFISYASDKMIPYNNIAVNILIDCSQYIGFQSKLFNMMIVCGMTYALNAIEIPYSVALISDNNFRCIIKNYDEPHSVEVLQRILDCVLIKRYRTNIANSLQYALKYMRYPDKTRNHHAIFTFTSGLDENLRLAKSFAEKIFKQKEDSFGLIFIKSDKLKGDDLSYVEDIWNNFESNVTKFNAQSKVKVVSMSAEISTATYENLFILFSSMLKRDLDQHAKVSTSHNTPSFPESFPPLDQTQLDEFRSLAKEEWDGDKVFIQQKILPDISNEIDRIDISVYRGKLNKICSCKAVNQVFNKEFLLENRLIPQEKLISIFHPNKASQTILSNTGTEYDITALVLNIINPMPDPLIYLEEKGGLIRNYGVTIVIDSSFSCFNEFSASHSIQIIRVLLSSLATLNLPCLDLIIATNENPIVLCSEIETTRALKENSPIWNSLFSCLSTPCQSSDLASAIHAAFDLRRMRSTEYDSLLFVLTDGLFQTNEMKRILKYVNMCVQCGINTFGVGIGTYPVGIKSIFSQAVFVQNPLMIIKAIGYFFGDDEIEATDDVIPILNKIPTNDEVKSIFNKLIEKEKSPIFPDLKLYLSNKDADIEANDLYINKEMNVKNSRDEFFNPEGANTEMYVKGVLNGQKILIVMLWTNKMAMHESPYVNPYYIDHNPENSNTCIANCIGFYGVGFKVVHTYEDAVKEMTKQTISGKCDYYAVWVINGRQYANLPGNGMKEDVGAYLIGEFIDCLLVFWRNGGSVVLWNDGSGLCYQTNLFLEKARFIENNSVISTKLRLDDTKDHAGKQTLQGDDTGALNRRTTFNRRKYNTDGSERLSLSHNLGVVYEGETTTYVKNENDIYPFSKFARDSDGGIGILFYPMVSLDGPGNIIIDGGFTKLFLNLMELGTARYIQNIAGWTANIELILRMGKGIRPCDWRPKAIKFTLNSYARWNGFKQIIPEIKDKKDMPTIFAIDNSGSVDGEEMYHDKCKETINKFYKSGDRIFIWGSRYEEVSIYEMMSIISKRAANNWGTDSDLIADILAKVPSYQREHLVIITDGQVGNCCIDRSDQKMLNNGISLKHVTFYVFVTNDSGVNTSVGIPFCRGSAYEAFKYRKYYGEEKILSVRPEDLAKFNNMKNVSTYDEFLKYYSAFSLVIYSKTAGKNRDDLIVRNLTAMKTRIEARIPSYQRSDFTEKYENLYRMADQGLRNLVDVAVALRK